MATVRRGNFPQKQMPPPSASDGQTVIDGVLKVTAVTPTESGPGMDRRTRNGKFTLAQLRQTDGIVPLQSGTNQFDSQRGKTGFGMPRNTSTRVEFADGGKRYRVEELTQRDNLIRLQSGTNKFDSQKGMTGFGMPRDVKGKHLKRIWELEFPEEDILNQPPVNQMNNGSGPTSPSFPIAPPSQQSPRPPQQQRPQQQPPQFQQRPPQFQQKQPQQQQYQQQQQFR